LDAKTVQDLTFSSSSSFCPFNLIYRTSHGFPFASRRGDSGFKGRVCAYFNVPVAIERFLALSGCGLRSCAARRIAIDLPHKRPPNQLPPVSIPPKSLRSLSARHAFAFGDSNAEYDFIVSAFDKAYFWANWLIMENIQQDDRLADRLSEADSVPIANAARELGLDVYTLYTFIQRERVRAGLSPTGEFVIPKSEVERLARKE
jgi:hypothetical protein